MISLVTYSKDLEALIAKAKEVANKYDYIHVSGDVLSLVMPKTGTNYNTIDGITHTSSHIQLPESEVFDSDGNVTGFMEEFEGILYILGAGINRHPTECPHLKAWANEDTKAKYDLAYPIREEFDINGKETGSLMPRAKFGEFDL